MMIQIKGVTFIPDLHEVFSTTEGTVYQCDKANCLYLNFAGKQADFKLATFLRLKKALEKIDVEHMLTDSNSPNVEIILINGCPHCYVLTALEIIALKELLDGAIAMFHLNHLIKDCLYRLVV